MAAQAAKVGGPVTKRVFFDIDIGEQPAGRIVIGLYGKALSQAFATRSFANPLSI